MQEMLKMRVKELIMEQIRLTYLSPISVSYKISEEKESGKVNK